MVLFHLNNQVDPNSELWFRLNGMDVYFSPMEFAFVTNLIFGHDVEVSHYVNCSERLILKEEYFSSVNISLHYIDI